MGTQHGMVHILSYEGAKISSYRPHSANITDIRIDEDNEFVATASFEGRCPLSRFSDFRSSHDQISYYAGDACFRLS